MLKVWVLGRFGVELAGERAEISSRPAQSLLAYLILSAGVSHRREKLAGHFWPDSDESNARSNLRHALWRLRQGIGANYLLANKVTVAFNDAAPYWLDAALLTALPAAAATIDPLLETVAAYKGELLPGFYDDWVLLERERLHLAFARVMVQLLDQLLSEQQWDDALQWAERWLSFGQAPEPAFRALMQAHAGQGDLAGVAAAYERCVQTLREELAVEPSAETRILYERLAVGEAAAVARQAEGRHVGLPLPVTAARAEPAFLAEVNAALPGRKEPFFGRERELAQLDDFRQRARAGRGEIVFISGETGRGKSSLLNEMARRALAADDEIVVASGACVPYTGMGDPLLPFRDVLNKLAGDVEDAWAARLISREAARRLWQLAPQTIEALLSWGRNLIDSFIPVSVLRQRAAAAGMAAAAQQALQTLIDSHLAGRPEMGLNQSQLFAQFEAVLGALAAQRPLLLILDDLHWIDLSSTSLLAYLSQRLRDRPVLILGAYRPEEVARGRQGEPHPLAGLLGELKRQYGEIVIDLEQETSSEARRFVDALLDAEANELDEAFRRRFTRRTGGHPLFSVELLQAMRARGELVQDEEGRWQEASGLAWDTLPARIEGVIETRLGRLDPELRRILNVASVEGSTFTAEVVAVVQESSVPALVRQLSSELARRDQLIQESGLKRLDGQRLSRYRFRHALFQQYLLQELDEVERAYLHEAVGLALEALYGEHVAEIAPRLARHFEAAGLIEKAVTYRLLAGKRAVRLSADEEAVAHLQRGLALLQTMPDLPKRDWLEIDLQMALGTPLLHLKGWAAPEVGEAYDRALALGRQTGDERHLFQILWNLWRLNVNGANLERTEQLLAEVVALAHDGQDRANLLQAHHATWTTKWHQADLPATLDACNEGLAVYDPGLHREHTFLYGGHDAGVCAHLTSAFALWYLGYPDQALARVQASLRLAEELAHPYSLTYARGYIAGMHVMRREANDARNQAQKGIAYAAAQGYPAWVAWFEILLGWAMVWLGEEDDGLVLMRRAAESVRELGGQVWLPYLAGLLAEAYEKAGQIEAGLATVNEALQAVAALGAHFAQAELLRLRGRLLLASSAPVASSATHFKQALEVARRQKARLPELRATVDLARLWLAQGRAAEARRLLTPLLDWFTEGLETTDLKQARELLAQLEK